MSTESEPRKKVPLATLVLLVFAILFVGMVLSQTMNGTGP